MRFQTKIGTFSELHRTAVHSGIRTAGTAGIVIIFGIKLHKTALNRIKPHKTTLICMQVLTVLCGFCSFAISEPHRTAGITKTTGITSTCIKPLQSELLELLESHFFGIGTAGTAIEKSWN